MPEDARDYLDAGLVGGQEYRHYVSALYSGGVGETAGPTIQVPAFDAEGPSSIRLSASNAPNDTGIGSTLFHFVATGTAPIVFTVLDFGGLPFEQQGELGDLAVSTAAITAGTYSILVRAENDAASLDETLTFTVTAASVDGRLPTTMTDTVTHGPITYTLAEAVPVAYDSVGQPLLVAPNGVTILNRTDPAETVQQERTEKQNGVVVSVFFDRYINGTQVNPQIFRGNGLDKMMNGFDQSLAATFPLTVQPNDIVVGRKSKGVGQVDFKQRVGAGTDSVLRVVSEAPLAPAAGQEYAACPALYWTGRTDFSGPLLQPRRGAGQIRGHRHDGRAGHPLGGHPRSLRAGRAGRHAHAAGR